MTDIREIPGWTVETLHEDHAQALRETALLMGGASRRRTAAEESAARRKLNPCVIDEEVLSALVRPGTDGIQIGLM